MRIRIIIIYAVYLLADVMAVFSILKMRSAVDMTIALAWWYACCGLMLLVAIFSFAMYRSQGRDYYVRLSAVIHIAACAAIFMLQEFGRAFR